MSNVGGPSSRPSLCAPFRVAVAQIAPALGNLQANLKLHQDQVAAARQAGADLIVFPELSLTGYYLRDQVPEVAEPIDGPLVHAICSAAGSTAVVFGFVEESPEHRFYNTAVLVDGGAVLATHRKVYLPTYGMFDEQRYFASGHRVRTFETRFGRIGILICEDAWHLSCATILQADRADLVIIIANSPGRGVHESELGSQQTWNLIARNFAIFLTAHVVFANRVGYEDGVCFWGGSEVVGPAGKALAQALELEPSNIVAEVDPRDTRRQRILAPLARDERLDVTLGELERIRDEQYDRASEL